MAIDGINQWGYKKLPCDTEIRQAIDKITDSDDPRCIQENLPPGCQLIAGPYPHVDCEKYVLGTEGRRRSLVGGFPAIPEPASGDIVLYYKEDGGAQHIGRLVEGGFVVSKWGREGPVLKHPLDAVPSVYGDWVCFRRITREQIRECLEDGADLIIE